MKAADHPGKSTPTPISVPDGSKSVNNTTHCASSIPNATSSRSVVQPGDSRPADECPALVPKNNIEPEHDPNSRVLGVSSARRETYVSTRTWINKWLSGNHSPDLMHPNKSYPKSLEKLSLDHIKGDHLFPFVSLFGKFFADNALPKSRGTGVLDPSTKHVYFKAFRAAMHPLFPTHPYLQPGDSNIQWFTDLTTRFKRSAEQAALKDLSQYNTVKSTALYRDTSTDVHAEDSSAWGGNDIWYRAAERSE